MNQKYNLSKIKAFIGDDETVLMELIDLFLNQTPGMLETLKEGIQKEDYDQVYFYAHKLKSSIDNFSIAEISEDIRILENNAKLKTSLEDLPALVNKIILIIENTTHQIKKDFNK